MPVFSRWRAAAFAVAALCALAIAGDLLWMPVQVNDALGEILDAQQIPSVRRAFTGSLGTEAYLRPARIAQIKALFDAADGEHYWLIYRGFHAALLVITVLLFARALRVTTAIDFAASAVALTVLVGLHTFRGTVQEAFPINHFLEMVLASLIVLNLAQGRPHLWKDAAAALTLAAAVLTLESGVLVWVAAVTMWMVGARGISTRGIAGMTLVLACYAVLRFVYLDTGVPSLSERSAGYLFGVLDPPELEARFGAQPIWFYGYNVAASALSVLFSEPRNGVFEATREWTAGAVPPRLALPVATSFAMTALIAWTMVRRVRAYLGAPSGGRSLDDTARVLVLFAVMLGANAALSFAYTKDEIISVAGVFYALAAFVAMKEVFTVLVLAPGGPEGPPLRTEGPPLHTRSWLSVIGARRLVVVGVVLFMLSAGWAVRAAGVHYVLRSQAIKHQNDWANLPNDWKREGRWPERAEAQRLILQLRESAIRAKLPNVRIGYPDWPGTVWVD